MALGCLRNCGDVKLMNVNVFRTFPAVVMGICIGESLILGPARDWIGMTVVVITLACSVASLVRTWHPQLYLEVISVISGGFLISTAYLALITFDHKVLPEDSYHRPALNGTICSEVDTNDTAMTSICHGIWADELKSGMSLWISNVGLMINTALIRPPSLE